MQSYKKNKLYLSEESYSRTPKLLTRRFKNANISCILMEFYSWRETLLKKGLIKAPEDSYYMTYKMISDQLGLSKDVIARAIAILEKENFLIFDKKEGLPAMTYYRFNDDIMAELYEKEIERLEHSTGLENETADVSK